MIDTFSKFYYGHEVTNTNLNIPFDEGAGELNATINVGSYALSEYIVAVESALNAASVTRVFTVSVDRDTRLVTISADGTFDLLVSSGVTAGASAFALLGFTGADLTGASSYTGDSPSGSAYFPQFLLQDYVDEEDYREFISPSVNESASGEIEVVRFGINRFFEFSIKYITDEPMDNYVIKNNPNGRADARLFLRDITKRNTFEYMPDEGDSNTFFKVILEKIPGNKTATGYKIEELNRQNVRDIFEIKGKITLRVVE